MAFELNGSKGAAVVGSRTAQPAAACTCPRSSRPTASSRSSPATRFPNQGNIVPGGGNSARVRGHETDRGARVPAFGRGRPPPPPGLRRRRWPTPRSRRRWSARGRPDGWEDVTASGSTEGRDDAGEPDQGEARRRRARRSAASSGPPSRQLIEYVGDARLGLPRLRRRARHAPAARGRGPVPGDRAARHDADGPRHDQRRADDPALPRHRRPRRPRPVGQQRRRGRARGPLREVHAARRSAGWPAAGRPSGACASRSASTSSGRTARRSS